MEAEPDQCSSLDDTTKQETSSAGISRRSFLGRLILGGSLLAFGPGAQGKDGKERSKSMPDVIFKNGRITTLDPKKPAATAVAINDGRFMLVGSDREVIKIAGPKTQVIDLKKRVVVPGLNDSHIHPIRGGLNYNMELRWDGVPSLADALRMLKEQAQRI